MKETVSEHKSYSVLLSNRIQTPWVRKINLVNLESASERGGEEMRTVRGFDYCDGLKSALRKPLHTSPLFIKSEMHLHHIFLHLRLLGRQISRGAGPTDL